MFCNLLRPVSTWICRIVLELHTVSLLAPGCSFTTDESHRRPRSGQSRTARRFLWSPTSTAAFWEASSVSTWLHLMFHILMLHCFQTSYAKSKRQCVMLSQRAERSSVFFTGHCLAVRLGTNTERENCAADVCLFVVCFPCRVQGPIFTVVI